MKNEIRPPIDPNLTEDWDGLALVNAKKPYDVKEPVEILDRSVHPKWEKVLRDSEAAKRRKAVFDARDGTIRKLHATNMGISTRFLGKVFGLSHEQVRKIVHGSRTDTPLPREHPEGT